MGPAKFLLEFILRFGAKSPKFFVVFQIIMALLAMLGHLPTTLRNWFDVQMPDHFVTMCKDIAKYATGAFVMALLPADTKPVARTDDGSILKKTNDKKLPYTAVAEERQAVKELDQSATVAENVDMKIDEANKQ